MQLLRQILGLCVLRTSPEDLPADPRLAWVLAAAYLLAGGLIFMSEDGFLQGMAQAAVDALLLAAFVWLVLRWREFPERFVQTYTAMLGVSLVFTLVSWPLLEAMPEELGAEMSLPQVGLLLVLLWNLIAQGQVLRRALEIGAGAGLGLAFLFFLLSSLSIAVLFFAETST